MKYTGKTALMFWPFFLLKKKNILKVYVPNMTQQKLFLKLNSFEET